jgi:hypothetical protein
LAEIHTTFSGILIKFAACNHHNEGGNGSNPFLLGTLDFEKPSGDWRYQPVN